MDNQEIVNGLTLADEDIGYAANKLNKLLDAECMSEHDEVIIVGVVTIITLQSLLLTKIRGRYKDHEQAEEAQDTHAEDRSQDA